MVVVIIMEDITGAGITMEVTESRPVEAMAMPHLLRLAMGSRVPPVVP